MVQENQEVQGEMYKDLGLEQLPCQSERLVQTTLFTVVT